MTRIIVASIQSFHITTKLYLYMLSGQLYNPLHVTWFSFIALKGKHVVSEHVNEERLQPKEAGHSFRQTPSSQMW